MDVSTQATLARLSYSIIVGIILMCIAGNAYAQRTDFQSWTLVTAQVPLDSEKRWFIYGEAQPRVGDDVSRLERLLLRSALGYSIGKSTALYLGYAWTPTFTKSILFRTVFCGWHRAL